MPAHFIGWYLKVGTSSLGGAPGFGAALNSGPFSSRAVGCGRGVGQAGCRAGGPDPTLRVLGVAVAAGEQKGETHGGPPAPTPPSPGHPQAWAHESSTHTCKLPQSLFFVLINLFILFIYFWLRWVFVAARGLSLVVASGGYSSLRARASRCGGFSCCRARALGAQASVVVASGLSSCGSQALERRLSSCGARA